MRHWQSRLYLPESAIRQSDRTLRSKWGTDAGPSLWPACAVCSNRTGTRFAVESYGVAEIGTTLGGEPYTDIRARCHGHEHVARIEGLKWDMKRDGNQADIIRIAAIASIPFFSREGIITIPAIVFRSFVGAH